MRSYIEVIPTKAFFEKKISYEEKNTSIKTSEVSKKKQKSPRRVEELTNAQDNESKGAILVQSRNTEQSVRLKTDARLWSQNSQAPSRPPNRGRCQGGNRTSWRIAFRKSWKFMRNQDEINKRRKTLNLYACCTSWSSANIYPLLSI